MKKIILICLLLFQSVLLAHIERDTVSIDAYAPEYSGRFFTVFLEQCRSGEEHTVTYYDDDLDGVFDRLVINDCGMEYEEKLKPSNTKGGPDLELYKHKNTWFEIRLKNYNDFRSDAYFQVQVLHKGKVLGYWEHIMGSYTLIWKGVE